MSNIDPGTKTKNIVLTTAGVLPRNQDYEVIQLITSESVIGMNIVRDFFAGLSDFFGGRSSSIQKVLKELREQQVLRVQQDLQEHKVLKVIRVTQETLVLRVLLLD